MHDGTGDTYWHFDDGLHLTHLASNRGDVTYGYDAGSRRTSMTAVGANPSYPYNAYTYGYDPGNRLMSLTNPFNEKTSFLYNNDGTVQKKTLANGAYTSYSYDPTNGQMTGLQFVYPGLGGSYSHAYTYTPAGSLASRSESDGGANSFFYDGMNQLVSEVRSGPVPFVHAYTYDHNGNRLTQSVNGSLTQSFAYDLHDKLTGGAGSGESESYDLNGNLTAQTVNGQTTRFTWDDEDRLASQQFPDGHSDSYGYTGLGMRLTKSDPTGSYSYLADGVSPASPVLTDGRTTFTPGISEVNGLGSRFYLPDGQGNSRGLLDSNQAAQDGYNWDGFGNSVSRFGSNPTGFAWNVSSGYQSDGDSGLKLLGHRYYDSRTGRFISQDPAGDGDNWYAYADNDPTDETDPTGLSSYFDPGMVGTPFDPSRVDYPGFNSGQPGVWDQYGSDGNGGWKYVLTVVHGGIWDQMNDPGNAHGSPAMFAASRQDVKTLKKLLDEAGYGHIRTTDHAYYGKPGKDPIKLPNVHSDGKDHRVVQDLKKRLEKEILEKQEEEVTDSEPSKMQQFWASRTDGQLVFGSVVVAGIIVGAAIATDGASVPATARSLGLYAFAP